jgi:hypothetical protein
MLIFVIGTLLVANAWGVIDAKLAVTAAAREGVRAYVESPAATAGTAAEDAAREAVEGQGRDPDTLVFAIDPVVERCAPVTARASYQVPTISLPWVGGLGHGFVVKARHTEIVDPYRSGLTGNADC